MTAIALELSGPKEADLQDAIEFYPSDDDVKAGLEAQANDLKKAWKQGLQRAMGRTGVEVESREDETEADH